MSTIYYCIPCVNKFVCKKNTSKKAKKDHKKEFKETGKVPTCEFCKKKHWRCTAKKCDQCCKLHKCNDVVCKHCSDNNIKCKRVLPRTQEEFDALKELGLSFSSGQYEYASSSGLFHEQAYFQFNDRKTIKQIKEQVFGHRAMNFPKYLNGDSKHNFDYSTKPWNRSKDVDKCRCDFFTHDNLCDHCVKKIKKPKTEPLQDGKRMNYQKKLLVLSSLVNT
ncbi:hypothetical protein C2G38_2293133 [Gigaspora rosea]|uniref:Uncharacterized protein n=1 Tax=Gigaspora rosea TaxID=44941 RepID=A0A397TVB7_9GLOM|nr:hypothetical protein C2G38_2293133 [Gigaspora rosea]